MPSDEEPKVDREVIAEILAHYHVEEYAKDIVGAEDEDADADLAFQELVEEVASILDYALVVPPCMTEKQEHAKIRQAAALAEKAADALRGVRPQLEAYFRVGADSLEDELKPDLAAVATGHLPPQDRRSKPNKQRNPVYEYAVDTLYSLLQARIEKYGGQTMLLNLLLALPGRHDDAQVKDQLRKTLLPRARERADREARWLRDDYESLGKRRRPRRASPTGGKKR